MKGESIPLLKELVACDVSAIYKHFAPDGSENSANRGGCKQPFLT
jgi:hypothetical protein